MESNDQLIDQEILKKSEVIKRELSLSSIHVVLREGFKVLQKIKGAHIVLVIGNTGSGKSTMLSSLLRGPEFLEVKQIQFTIEVPGTDGTTTTKQKSKQVIDNKEAHLDSDFIIGHSDVNSETFLPKFLYDQYNDLLFGDIAGL